VGFSIGCLCSCPLLLFKGFLGFRGFATVVAPAPAPEICMDDDASTGESKGVLPGCWKE